jgi:hypothetical protein
VPAAAVIPAPRAYIRVVAVKKLVVEPQGRGGFHMPPGMLPRALRPAASGAASLCARGNPFPPPVSAGHGVGGGVATSNK